MCGIIGILSKNPAQKRKIAILNNLLRHRGPDDEGYVCINSVDNRSEQFSGEDSVKQIKTQYTNILNASYDEYDIVFGHRRLSIIDLTEKGHCPMCDESGKLWITYNGEIYNYIELRDELKLLGYNFRTGSDTEVILYSYLQWGVECLNHFNGMWAFGLWDGYKKRLFLARDRFGVKPLYYTYSGNTFTFSSEMKPLVLFNPDNSVVNEDRIPFFILYGNRLNGDETYLKNIYSLKPSHYILFQGQSFITERYYDINVLDNSCKSEAELENELVELLSDSIKLRFRSDVPVGTCLSGGFDSSSIVSLSSNIYNSGLNTFSAVWEDAECDESKYIDLVNQRFNCFGNKVEPSVEEFDSVFDRLHYYQEIPTEGPGLYPQWYVMRKAKEKVKVLLDGQGGDEVFGGYFWLTSYLCSILKDRELKQLLKNFKLYFSFLNKNGVHSFTSWMFPGFYNKVIREKLSMKSKVLNEDLLSRVGNSVLHYDSEPPKKFSGYLNNLSYHFIVNLTIPTLLHYEDRSSMAHSIESRVPFLDYRLVEFGVNLPSNFLVDRETSRPLYRKALRDFLPEEIVNRKDKLGYPTPFAKWTRTVLKNLVIDALTGSNSSISSFINKSVVKANLEKHFKGEIDYSWNIWRLLSLCKFLSVIKSCSSK